MHLICLVLYGKAKYKNKCVSGKGLKIVLFWKKYKFVHFIRPSPFKMHKIIYFPESLKKNQVFTCKFR